MEDTVLNFDEIFKMSSCAQTFEMKIRGIQAPSAEYIQQHKLHAEDACIKIVNGKDLEYFQKGKIIMSVECSNLIEYTNSDDMPAIATLI